MAYNLKICVVLIVLIFFGSLSSARSNHDPPPSDEMRQKRHVESDFGGAAIPDLSATLQSQSTFQAAYFLGQCLICPPGPQGPPGQHGDQGLPGRDGRDALLVGLPSSVGSQQTVPGDAVEDVPQATGGSSPIGSTYTRWGRATCSEGSELVYDGVMAGSYYTHVGGAADYICLSKDPIFDRPTAGHQYGTYLYGTEYETGSSQLLPNLQDLEAPCAVCLTPSKSVILMVPGRNQCPEDSRDWRLEYSGFIMSGHHGHKRTMHVCVDREAEGVPRTHGDHNGALLYIVEAACVAGGGIPCPPYTTGFEVTCAVCSL